MSELSASFQVDGTSLSLNSEDDAMDSRSVISLSGDSRPRMDLEDGLKEAVIDGNVGKIRALIQANADVNRAYHKGITVLHMAVMRGEPEVLPILVRSGANVTALDDFGMTPMGLALSKGRPDLIEALMDGLPDTCYHRFIGPFCVICGVLAKIWVSFHLLDPSLRWDGWREAEMPMFWTEQSYASAVWTLAAITLGSLILVNQLDPGSVQREQVAYIPELKSLPEERVITLDDERFAIIHGDDEFDLYRWCRSCDLWKPRNVSHCSRCNRCYWRFDHHCAAVGNCVAARNHRFFALMLAAGAATWVMVLHAVYSCLAAHAAFSSLELWWPVRAEQWPLYLGLAYMVLGLGACLLVVWGVVHTGSLVLNYNTKMCLSPATDKQNRWCNTLEELMQLFCMPLRFRPCGGATPLPEDGATAPLASREMQSLVSEGDIRNLECDI